jgi:hypothetical protein
VVPALLPGGDGVIGYWRGCAFGTGLALILVGVKDRDSLKIFAGTLILAAGLQGLLA